MGLRGKLRARHGIAFAAAHTSSGAGNGGGEPAATCNYYASPTGSGTNDGLTQSTPFRIDDFFALGQTTMQGKTLCLMNGTYQGSSQMIDPNSGISGTETQPITIRALNDGQALLDGQFARAPISMVNNQWWVLEGFNAKNGTNVARLEGAHNTVLKRIVMWDADFTRNTAVAHVINSEKVLFEDVAAFGTGIVTIINSPNSVTQSLTLRRVWGRWEGSSNDTSPGVTLDIGYGGQAANIVCDNCMATWSGKAMPTSVYTVTNHLGNSAGSTLSSGQILFPNSLVRLRSDLADQDNNTNIYGSVAYINSDANIFPPTGSALRLTMFRFPSYGFTGRNVHLSNSLAFVHPSHTWFSGQGTRGFDLTTPGGIPTNLTADKVTSIAGENIAQAPWVVTNNSYGSSLAAVQSPWTATSTGANLCYRYVNGVRQDGTGGTTLQKLWPWPMNDRIKAATLASGQPFGASFTGTAGANGNPCLNCSGVPAARAEYDFTADIEAKLGTIPAGCRN